jgi:uncharacterized protein (DUF885 family)
VSTTTPDPSGEAPARSGAAPGDAPAAFDPSGAARDLAARYWDALLELDPIMASQIGDDRFDHLMPDTTEEGVARAEAIHRSALAEAAAIERSDLNETDRSTLDVLDAVAGRALESIRMRTDRLTSVTHLFGPGQVLVLLGSIQRADTPERVDRYLDRLASFPAFLRGLREAALAGLEGGITQPKLVVQRSIGQIERLLEIPVEESPAMAPVASASPEARERTAHVLREVVTPAYRAFLEMLRAYHARTRDSIGLGDLPDGERRYAVEIRAWTTVSLGADEVHRIGLDEMESIEEEKRAIAEGLGFASAEEALAQRAAEGQDTPSGREEIVRLAEQQVRRGWEAARAVFGRLPQALCEVRAVEEFRERDTPFAYYQPGAGDGSRPGIYYVNTGSPEERKLHQLATVSFHEANPGHHFQTSIEQEYADRPALRRFGGLLVGSAFIEGWGLYAERLADELGLYADDYERLGMLEAQAWRAARLVTDTGIHALGWDRERAVEYVDRATGGPRANSEIEIDRYIAWPAQALSYKIGHRELQRFRREAEQRRGSEFSLKDFHDRLLELGSLPLPVLQRELAEEEEA